MTTRSFGLPGPAQPATVETLRIVDRFEPDRQTLSEIFARPAPNGGEAVLIAELKCMSELVELVLLTHGQNRPLEMTAALGALQQVAERIGLTPVTIAAKAVCGAQESGNPHALGATLARLDRLAERALVETWSFCV